MAAPSPVITEAAANSGLVKGTLLAALIERVPFVLKSSETLSGLLSQSAGLIYNVVHSQATGFAYYYNASDTTTPDDGITCLVDADGHRYLVADGADLNVSTVLGLQNAPPGSPVVGDSYIVGIAPTGAWAAHASDIAVWTLRGWVFAQPGTGQTVYRQDTNGNTQYDEAGNWVGFAISFAAGDIPNSALDYPFGIAAEAQQNDPPVSPGTGQWYIIGTVPTGAWVGHANDVAYWNGTGWEFFDPYDGASVYNKSTDLNLNWNGTAWLGVGGSQVTQYDTPGGFTWTKPAVGVVAHVQLWAAGASGGKGSTGCGGGGGGGSWIEFYIRLSDLPSTVSVTVGAGGAAITTANTVGAAGGNSSFGTYGTAYGGSGGRAASGTDGGNGGGGGGQGGAGVTSAGGVDLIGGTTFTHSVGGNGGQAGTNAPQAATAGNPSYWGGAGGGGGQLSSTGTGTAGGKSGFGGGGGGGGAPSGGTGAGGVSTLAGNGGAGGVGAGNAVNGVQPGGGGGGSRTGNSGKGGDGRVRVTVY